jgi:hypothetical protein
MQAGPSAHLGYTAGPEQATPGGGKRASEVSKPKTCFIFKGATPPGVYRDYGWNTVQVACRAKSDMASSTVSPEP